jgi:ubiquinone biosynthesis monooxygenase Coq7
MRQPHAFEHLIQPFNSALQALCPPNARRGARLSPADSVQEGLLNTDEKRHAAALVRINHAGEICAQALYQGQALTAKLDHIKEKMKQAADEELDHLAWCEQRLHELDDHPSWLNVLWYGGALLVGASAGLCGDAWSLGFVVETEQQVTRHLTQHLQRLPCSDKKTHAILTQMQHDEAQHARTAKQAGARELPSLIKLSMQWMSKLLTTTCYYV